MKNLLTYLILALLVSCSSDNEPPSMNTSEERVFTEVSYIINGEKLKLQIDITDKENSTVVKTKDSDLILSLLEKENSVFYYNPEINDIVLFEDFKTFSSFINDGKQVQALKTKFNSKILPSNSGILSKSTSGPIYGATPSVTVYEHSNYNGVSFSFNANNYMNPNLGNTVIGHDRTSSIEVINAYAGFWEHPDFVGKLLIIDSYNYHTQIANLKDAKFNSFTIYNGTSSSSNHCGWLCGSHWNDRISSIKARGDGIKSF